MRTRWRQCPLEDGDILCVRSGRTGPAALVTAAQADWVFSTNLLRLRPRMPDLIDPRYLLALPPMPEQRRIGAALRALDLQVAAYRSLGSAAEQTRAAVAQHLLSGDLILASGTTTPIDDSVAEGIHQ